MLNEQSSRRQILKNQEAIMLVLTWMLSNMEVNENREKELEKISEYLSINYNLTKNLLETS